jgi:hypothetical protein
MTAGTSARVRLLHMRDEVESLSQEPADLPKLQPIIQRMLAEFES